MQKKFNIIIFLFLLLVNLFSISSFNGANVSSPSFSDANVSIDNNYFTPSFIPFGEFPPSPSPDRGAATFGVGRDLGIKEVIPENIKQKLKARDFLIKIILFVLIPLLFFSVILAISVFKRYKRKRRESVAD